jgi:multiple sugar transport system substrate-binding protein
MVKWRAFKSVKTLFCGTSILLSLALVVGCSGGDKSAGEVKKDEVMKAPVTITAWLPPVLPEDKLKKIAADFNAKSQDVKVDLTVLDWNTGREKIKTAMISGQGPDVFYLANGLDQAYVDGGVLAAVDTVGITKEQIDKYDPMINMNAVNGKIYALPLNYDVYVQYYRKDLLKAAGFDKPAATWDELKSMAKAMTKDTNGDGKADVLGFQLKGADDHLNAINLSWQSILAAAGGNFIDKNGKSSMNSPEGVQALSYLKSFFDEKISVQGPSAANGFPEGKVAMFFFVQNVGDVNKWNTIEELKGKWAMAPMPKGPKSSASYVGGHAVAVNAKAKNAQAAGKFLAYFASPENSVNYMDEGHGVPPFLMDKIDPAVKKQIEDKINSDKENWNAIFEQLKNSSPELSIQGRIGYTARWDAQKAELIAPLMGAATVEQTLKNLDARINQAIGK